jgi:hypothetical protein
MICGQKPTFDCNVVATCSYYCVKKWLFYTMLSGSRCAVIKVLEVMSTSVYTGLCPFNFIRKHFLQICVRKVAVYLSNLRTLV